MAAAGAMAPLALVLLASVVLLPSSGPTAPGAGVGIGSALALTFLSVIAAAVIAVLSAWLPAQASRWALSVCGAIAGAGAGYVMSAPVVANPTLRLGLAAVLGIGWGSVVARLGARQQPPRAVLMDRIPERDRVQTPVSRSPGQQNPETVAPAWSTSIRSRRMSRLAVFGAVVFTTAVVLSAGVAPWWWVGLLSLAGVVFCVFMLAWSRVSLRIDADGLSIDSDVIGRVLIHCRASEILGVGSTQIDPLDWGGWGLHWSRRHTAFVVAGGPGIVVHRSSGRALAIEITDPAATPDSAARMLRAIASAA